MLLLEESRGFLFWNDVGQRIESAFFVPVRKKGKLPFKTIHQNYQLEYGSAALELFRCLKKRIGRCWYTMIF